MIAAEAGISVATAYRHFTSVEEVLNAYCQEVGQLLLDKSIGQRCSGMEKLENVSRYWIKLVRERGAAMVPMRNHRGLPHTLTQAANLRPVFSI